MTRRMPPRLLPSSVGQTVVGELWHRLDDPKPEDELLYVPGQVWLCGMIIPPFQRPVVWDEHRMVRFVESAWLGLPLGQYVVNNAADEPMVGGRFHRTDLWLIDGQQRVTALDRYFRDGFPVFGAHWSELSVVDQRRFHSVSFPRTTVRMTDEHELRVLYDRLNYGGVAHTADQRALPDGEAEAWRGPKR